MFHRRFDARRKLAAIASLLAAAAAIAPGCTDDFVVDSPRSDSGAPEASLGESVCPTAAPADGEGCLLPEGTTCAFGACSARIAQCTRGAWRYSGNPPPRPDCPKDFPASQSACPPCWPSGVECTYGSTDCTAPDASANTTVASCTDAGAGQPGRWSLRTFACAPSDGGGDAGDAGADVQRDAEPDAD